MTLLSAGAPTECRLGRSGDENIPLPVVLRDGTISCIGAGWKHTIVVFEDGTCVGWGNNQENQLGVVSGDAYLLKPTSVFMDYRVKWVHCGDRISSFLTDEGDVYAVGSIYGGIPVKLKTNSFCVFCTCGVGMILAIDSNGDVFVCTCTTCLS